MTFRSKLVAAGTVAIAVGTLVSGCSTASDGTAGSESSTPAATTPASAAPAMTVSEGCRKALLATKDYLAVSAQHPKEFLPGKTYSPAEAPEVREAAQRTTTELRGVTGGLTDASVRAAVDAQIKDLEYVISGSPDDPTTLEEFMDSMRDDTTGSGVAELYKACGAAAPELAKDPDLKLDLNVHVGENGADAEVG